jgi:hypothetical protein
VRAAAGEAAEQADRAARGTVQEGKGRDSDWEAVAWVEAAAPAQAQVRAPAVPVAALVRAEVDCGSPAECPAAVSVAEEDLGLAGPEEDQAPAVGRGVEVAVHPAKVAEDLGEEVDLGAGAREVAKG